MGILQGIVYKTILSLHPDGFFSKYSEKVSIRISSLIGNVESRKLAGSCFVLFLNSSAVRTNGAWWEQLSDQVIWCIKSTVSWSSNENLWNFGANHSSACKYNIRGNGWEFALYRELVKLKNSSRERAFVVQQLETWFLTVKSRVCFPPGSVGAHCRRIPNRNKHLSSAPVSFELSTLLINAEFLL